MPTYYRVNGLAHESLSSVDTDSIGVDLGGGKRIELTIRKSDNAIRLDCSGGVLVILPRAANMVTLEVTNS